MGSFVASLLCLHGISLQKKKIISVSNFNFLGLILDVNMVAEPKPHQIGRKRQNVSKTGNDWYVILLVFHMENAKLHFCILFKFIVIKFKWIFIIKFSNFITVKWLNCYGVSYCIYIAYTHTCLHLKFHFY